MCKCIQKNKSSKNQSKTINKMCLFEISSFHYIAKEKTYYANPTKKKNRTHVHEASKKTLRRLLWFIFFFFYFIKVFRFFVLKKYWHVPKDIYTIFIFFVFSLWRGAISFILFCLFFVIKQIFELFLLEELFFYDYS